MERKINIFKAFITSRGFLGTIIGLAAIALIAFLYFYPDAAQGNVLRQHDMQQGTAIGQEAKLFKEATGETTRWTNSLFSGMPTFQISPSYSSNSLFSWINGAMGLFLPQPANLLAMMMLGFFILLLALRMRWYIALIGAVAYAFSSYFIIIIGAGHIWKFITLAYVPPTVAGVILCYRGRYLTGAAMAALFAMMQICNNHVQMSYYFLFVIAALSIAYLVRAIRRRHLGRWCIATGALAVAAALAVGANLPNLYNTFEYSRHTMRGGHSELTQPGAAPQATAGGLDKDYITQYSYGRAETFTLLIPNVKGGASNKPEKGQNKILTLSAMEDAPALVAQGKLNAQEAQYLDYMSQYFGEPEGTNGPVYVGALVCVLFLIGCFIIKGPVKWALLAVTVLSLLLALGRNCMWLTDLMIDWFPMYNKFRTVESILVIAEFTMPLLAIMALQKLLLNRGRWSEFRKPVLWSFGIVAAFCIIGAIWPGFYGSAITDNDRAIDSMITRSLMAQGYDYNTAQYFSLSNPRIYSAVESLRLSMVSSDSLRSLLFVLAGLAALWLFFMRRLSVAATALVAGVIIFADLFTVNKRYLNTDSFLPRTVAAGEPFPLTAADAKILADTTAHYRVMNIPQFWSADPSYRHKAIGGYHAAKLTRYQDLIDRHLTHFLDNSQTDADWEVLNMLNAKYIVDPRGEVLTNPDALGNAWLIDSLVITDGADAEMAALATLPTGRAAVADRSFAPALGAAAPVSAGDSIYLTSYAPNRLTYSATTARGGIAVFSEVYFPWGWKATVDGVETPIARVNYLLRALRLPAGHHTVVMTFDPPSIRATVTAATVSVILIYLLVAAALAAAMLRFTVRTEDEA